ncbi:MAG: hypothetical protein KAG97_01415 [Victivallales bacterium]|nr:hypothetical protein [Victivallales bacterium]
MSSIAIIVYEKCGSYKVWVALVEKNHKYERQPDGEVVDLYECPYCRQQILIW